MKKLLQFKATWCAPCSLLQPLINKYSNLYDIISYDVDIDSEITQKYKIKSVPTVIIIDEEEEVRLVGQQINKQSLDENIKVIINE